MNMKITTVLNWLAVLYVSIGILLAIIFPSVIKLYPSFYSFAWVFYMPFITAPLMLVIVLINLILALCWKRYMGAVIAFVLLVPFVCVVGLMSIAIIMMGGHGNCGHH